MSVHKYFNLINNNQYLITKNKNLNKLLIENSFYQIQSIKINTH